MEARASAPSSQPPRPVSWQASWAGECWLSLILCAGISLLCPPHPWCHALLRGSEAPPSPPPRPPSQPSSLLPWRGFLVCGNLSSFTAPSHWCTSCPYSLSLFFLFFLLPYPGMWGVSCLLGGLRSSTSVQYVFCKSCSTCRCISDVFVRRKVIFASYSSAILKLLPFTFLYMAKPSCPTHLTYVISQICSR